MYHNNFIQIRGGAFFIFQLTGALFLFRDQLVLFSIKDALFNHNNTPMYFEIKWVPGLLMIKNMPYSITKKV